MSKQSIEALEQKLSKAQSELQHGKSAPNQPVEYFATSGKRDKYETGPDINFWKEVGVPLGNSILLFGFAVMLVVTWLIRTGSDVNAIIRAFALILIIVAAIFLVVTGYDEQQIAPVLGLLGTIAGYLLGNSAKTPAPPSNPNT